MLAFVVPFLQIQNLGLKNPNTPFDDAQAGFIRYAVIGEYDWTQDAARKAILSLLPPGSLPAQPRAGGSYSASSGTFSFVPLTTMPPRSPGATLP